jgi:hypothetical protein
MTKTQYFPVRSPHAQQRQTKISYYENIAKGYLSTKKRDGKAVNTYNKDQIIKKIVSIVFFIAVVAASPAKADWATTYAIDRGNNVGLYPSMQIQTDSESDAITIHVTYYDAESTHLKYAKVKRGQVTAMWEMDYADNVGKYNALELNSKGQVHVSYYDKGNGDLKYIFYDGVFLFKKNSIDSEGDVGLFTSIAVDESDKPHISYYDKTNGDLKYAVNNGTGWEVSVVDEGGDVGKYSSMALDSTGTPHIAYYDETNGALKYASFDGSEWKIETVDSVRDVGRYCSLAIDTMDLPHIAYYDDNFKKLKYAFLNGSRWNIKFVISKLADFFIDYGSYCSLKVDSQNNPHISYYNETFNQIEYTTLNGFFWEKEIPYTASFSGPYNCLVLDSLDNPYIAVFTSLEKPDIDNTE